MIIDPIILLAASLALFVGGLAKGVMGFGLPILAIPIVTALSTLPYALSLVVLPVVATNLWQVWSFRAARHVPFLPRFILVGMGGLLAGTLLLKNVQNAYLEIALGCLVMTYLGSRRTHRKALAPARQLQIAPVAGCLAGVVHGTTGLSGMVGTPFFHAAGLGRPAFIFCNGLMFTVFSMLHMPTLAALGLYQTQAVLIGAITVIPAFAGVWLGSRLGARLSASAFPIIVQCMLATAAVLPIWNGLSKLGVI